MAHDDFAVEPVDGLPEELPEGEVILWQGRPNWWALAWEALNLPWVIAYFVLLTGWHFLSVVDQMSVGQAIGSGVPYLLMGLIVVGLLLIVGYIQARAALYTVTNRRIVMRIGAALTLTLNLPYSKISQASLSRGRRDTGTIALETTGETRLGYLVCWPHVRPWYFSRPQPALREIPDVETVAQIVSRAAQSSIFDQLKAISEVNRETEEEMFRFAEGAQ